jgi:sigma-B regulation protein RsbU (phosphoserine phosphatase)
MEPENVLSAANARILQDARANLFVTVFYGVLDLDNGQLTYCNAGHTPPVRLKSGADSLLLLSNTGMPLGIDSQPALRRAVVQLDPGDLLFLHTDGITDAQNERGEFIDRQSLYDLIQALRGQPAQTVQQGVLDEIHRFSGPAAQFDDITMMVLVRR